MIIRYNETRQRFEASTTFAERNEANPLLKKSGFAFDFNGAKVWHTAGYKAPKPQAEQIQIAAKLADYCDEAAKARIGGATIEAVKTAENARVASLDASRATDSTVDIPKPEGLEYLPYQRAGIAYATQRTNVLIADEMGLGKTIQAIGVSNADASVRSVLIVCPASLKLNWRREWTKWDVKGLTVGVAYAKEGVPQTDVVIVNFDILAKLDAQLRARNWDLLVADECHKVKNPKAQRTQQLLGYRVWNKETHQWDILKTAIAAKRRVFLTGTPIVNRPNELWPFVLALDPDGLGRYKSKYEKRYCGAGVNAYGYYQAAGATNLDELQERLRSSFMIRRLKADVLKDLPPKVRQVVVLATDDCDNDIFVREKAAYEDAVVLGKKVRFEALSAARKAVAIEKIPFAIDFINGKLEETDKVVVFAHHYEVVDALRAHFGNAAVVVDGRVTNLEDRQAAVDRFQTDPTCRVFIGTIQAAGVGLTLTAASTVIFVELDWVPGNVTQAEDRCHRIGQHDVVNVFHLVFDNSVDGNLVGTIISKQAVISAALDNIKPEPAKPVVGDLKLQPKPGPMTLGQGRQTTTELAPEVVNAIHQALQELAAACDGARAIDGSGFNKFDSPFGKSLAARLYLTPNQALAGQKLVRKYQGQLSVELIKAAGIKPMEVK